MRAIRGWVRQVVGATAVLLLVVASPAAAITYGQPDGDGHPNVGGMLAGGEDIGWSLGCSGVLIADDVFLTAAHCTDFIASIGLDVAVTFDSVFDPATSNVITGTSHTHPDYSDFQGPGGTSNPYDIAVIILDQPASSVYPGIVPASLPTARLLDELNARNGLKNQRFTVVGYGFQEPVFGGGPPTNAFTGERRVAVSRFLALRPAWLHMSQVGPRGDGGTCGGDSGGPTFLGAGAQETDIVVSLTSIGDAMCIATGTSYRLDTPWSRDFLAQFVAVP